MAAIANLGYLVIAADDLDAWRTFATEILGLQSRDAPDGRLSLRLDEFDYRILITQGSANDISAAGWSLGALDDLERYAQLLRDRGLFLHRDDDLAMERGVERLYRGTDPEGTQHEFYSGALPLTQGDPFHSPLLAGQGFRTGALGAGHLLQNVRDAAAMTGFYVDVLGLGVSDHITQRDFPRPGMEVSASFFHAATGRHHSVAICQMPAPKRLNHFMIEAQSLDDVGLAYDRCLAAGVPLQFSLGHHPNDRMTSFYVITPSGFALEYGWGGIEIDPANWEVRTYSKLSDWGHKISAAVQF